MHVWPNVDLYYWISASLKFTIIEVTFIERFMPPVKRCSLYLFNARDSKKKKEKSMRFLPKKTRTKKKLFPLHDLAYQKRGVKRSIIRANLSDAGLIELISVGFTFFFLSFL